MEDCKLKYLTIDGHQLAMSMSKNLNAKSILHFNAIGCRMFKKLEQATDKNFYSTNDEENQRQEMVSNGRQKKIKSQCQFISKNKRKTKGKYLKKKKICERKVLRVPCFTYPRFHEKYPTRGRQTLCQQLHTTIIPDKFQTIHAANEIHQLENLLIKQSRYSIHHNGKLKQKPTFTATNKAFTLSAKNDFIEKSCYSLSSGDCLIVKPNDNRVQRVHHNECNRSTSSKFENKSSVTSFCAHSEFSNENLQLEIQSALDYNNAEGFQWHLNCLQSCTNKCSTLTDDCNLKRNKISNNEKNFSCSDVNKNFYTNQSILNYKCTSEPKQTYTLNNKISISIDNGQVSSSSGRHHNSIMHSSASEQINNFTKSHDNLSEVITNIKRLNLSNWDRSELPIITLTDYTRYFSSGSTSPELTSYVISDADFNSISEIEFELKKIDIDQSLVIPFENPTGIESRPPAVSQRSIDLEMQQTVSADADLAKRTLKLKLSAPTSESVKGQMMKKLKSQGSATSTSLSPKSPTSSGKKKQIRSISQYSMSSFSDETQYIPTSGKSGGARSGALTTQTSITTPSQPEVVDDRKALRDALYQGIFHRHRRTIFAVGSFLRMLKSKNSQYNTIRSTSENEDESR